MNSKYISIILAAVEIKCPLCKFTCNKKTNCFRSRSRYNLRKHLQKEHTEAEVEKYVRKIL